MEADSPLTKRSLNTACQVVPWLELAYDQGQDLNATQYGDDDGIPRVFKSHAWYDHCPKGLSFSSVF
jgi:hypothetical protein